MDQNNQQIKKRNDGRFSIDENKLRITNSNGISSVLFEDISSISYTSVSSPNRIIIILGVIIMISGFFLNSDWIGWGIGCIVMILGFVYQLKWDDILVETRGGKILTYSVDTGEGYNQVEEIERMKREITSKN